MMAQTPTQVIFYVYKSRPGASPESEYISEILRLAFEVGAKPCNSLCSPGGVSQFHYLQGRRRRLPPRHSHGARGVHGCDASTKN